MKKKETKYLEKLIARNKFLEAFLHTFIGIFAALRYNPDILHIQAIGPGIFTPMARLLGMKVIVTSHGSDYMKLKWGKSAKLFPPLISSYRRHNRLNNNSVYWVAF